MGKAGICVGGLFGMRILVVLTDAFGGHGGIAQYNRDLLSALCSIPEISEVIAVPRTLPFPPGDIPAKLRYYPRAAGSKLRFIFSVLAVSRGKFDLIICGHINLLPIAVFLKRKLKVPLVMQIYGIDVWQPHASMLVRKLIGSIDAVWSISEITREKMSAWSAIDPSKFVILPNGIDLNLYSQGAKRRDLVERYGLEGHKVILTLCRLPSAERYKGVDEVLNVMPNLLIREPSLIYLVAGDGDDRVRLELKAKTLGVSSHVVFTGFVHNDEKVDHFRLADAFVMPGRGEGFGFVYLEALACGVPVVASKLDGSREAVRGGLLGSIVNPMDTVELEAAIIKALNQPLSVPAELSYFSMPEFQKRAVRATMLALRT